jgi:hypothetical protein
MLMELDGLNENAVRKKYTWGLDLAGQSGSVGILPATLASAGCPLDNLLGRQGQVGGLSALEDVADPNDATGAIVAHYECDPYGNVTA